MNTHLPDESPLTRELRKRFDEKRLELARLERRLEKLKTELFAIKHEHDVRIGVLLRESDQLDYDIFEARKINDLMARGSSYEEAKKLVEERAFAEFMKARARAEAEEMTEPTPAATGPKKIKEKVELKRLFRKLAMKYHPDRADGDEEKMKEVNRAYADGNIEALRALDRDEEVERAVFLDHATLERHIASIENSIDRLKQRFRAFTRSEWYLLKKEIALAKKEEGDLFVAWEKRLKNEIAQKKRTLAKERKSHE